MAHAARQARRTSTRAERETRRARLARALEEAERDGRIAERPSGPPRRESYAHITPRTAAIVRAYTETGSFIEAARRIGVGVETVRQHVGKLEARVAHAWRNF